MAVDAGLFISLSIRKPRFISQVLSSLLSSGWVYVLDGNVTFLPKGDNGNYEWQSEPVAQFDLYSYVADLENNGETVGITLMNGEDEVGGDLLLFSDGKIIFSIQINRKIAGHGFTDIDWYLRQLVVPITKAGFELESLEFHESV
jgi:hypothetical protein